MLVGEAPGRHEDATGKVFVGPAGQKLLELAALANLNLEDAFITNAVKCRPPLNRTPKISEIRACRQYLLAEIQAAKPTLIIALGLVALRSLLDKGNAQLKDYIGHPLTVADMPPIIATYHPAAVLRFPHLQRDWVSHVTRGITGETPVANPTQVHVRFGGILNHPSVRTDSLDRDSIFLGFDLETYPGLNPWADDARIRLTALSAKQGEAVVSKDVTLPFDDDVWLCGSNIKFDLKWLKITQGVEVANKVWDTKVAERLLCPQNTFRGLKALVLKYAPQMGPYAEYIRNLVRQRGGWEHITDDELIEYAGNDADGSRRVAVAQRNLMSDTDLRLMHFYSDLTKHLARVEVAGMRIDTAKLDRLILEYKVKIDAAREKLIADLGVNPDSPKQLAVRLNLPATDKAILRRVVGEYKPIVRALLDYRSLTKLYRTYLLGIRKSLDKHGRIHPEFLIDGTDTGRLSSRNPNGQNIANVADIKSLFIGNLVAIDLAQAEIWALAILSGDTVLLQDLLAGEDIHVTIAKRLTGKVEITQQERKLRKTSTFNIIYGGDAYSLAQRTGFNERHAQRVIDAFYGRYRGVKAWQIRTRHQARTEGYVETLFGRRYTFPPGIDWASKAGRHYLRFAVNMPVQGTVGMLTQHLQLALEAGLSDCQIIGQVHDEILLDTPAGGAVECKRRVDVVVPEVTRHLMGYAMPYTVKAGVNWAEMELLKC